MIRTRISPFHRLPLILPLLPADLQSTKSVENRTGHSEPFHSHSSISHLLCGSTTKFKMLVSTEELPDTTCVSLAFYYKYVASAIYLTDNHNIYPNIDISYVDSTFVGRRVGCQIRDERLVVVRTKTILVLFDCSQSIRNCHSKHPNNRKRWI